jgi:hypothetical protein
MAGFVFGADAASDPVVRTYREHHVRYTVGVVSPNAMMAQYQLDFGTGRCNCFDETLDRSGDLVHRIAASALAG